MPFHQPNLVCGCGRVHAFDIAEKTLNQFECSCGVSYTVSIGVPLTLMNKLKKGEPTTQDNSSHVQAQS